MELTHYYKGHVIELLVDPPDEYGKQWYCLTDGSRFGDTWDERKVDGKWVKIEPPEWILWATPQAALAYAQRSIDYERGECDCPDCVERKEAQRWN